MICAVGMTGESSIASVLIAAISGLGGAALGAWLTARSQKAERRNARIRQQVDEFYAPLLAMRVQIFTKSTVRTKIAGAADTAWRQLAEGTQKEKLQALLTERFPDWEKIIEENNRQLVEEL